MRAANPLKLAGAALLSVLALGAAGYRADLPYDQVRAAYETATSRWIDVQGAQLHYTDQGSGPVVVMLHGSGADQGVFTAPAHLLAQRGYRVIALDLPGSGLSQAGPDTGFTIPANTALLGAFLTALDLQPAALLGHSTGGQIAWTFALDAPDLAPRLILLAPTGQPTPSPLAWQIAALPVLGPMLKNVTPQIVVRQNLRDAVFDDSAITEAQVIRYHDLLLREGARDALFARMQAVSFARVKDLPCLHQPVLLLWGQEDIWLPPALGRDFEQALPAVTHISLPGTGHNLPEELAPERFADLVADWLTTTPAQAVSTPCAHHVTH
jgi:pimeloyl-ACP methyl ester carboxylesterase